MNKIESLASALFDIERAETPEDFWANSYKELTQKGKSEWREKAKKIIAKLEEFDAHN